MQEKINSINENHKKILGILDEHEKKKIINEERNRRFEEDFKKAKEELAKLGDLPIEIDLDRIVIDAEYKAKIIEEFVDTISKEQESFLKETRDFASEVNS